MLEIGARSQFFGHLSVGNIRYYWKDIAILGAYMNTVTKLVIYFSNKCLKSIEILRICGEYVGIFHI